MPEANFASWFLNITACRHSQDHMYQQVPLSALETILLDALQLGLRICTQFFYSYKNTENSFQNSEGLLAEELHAMLTTTSTAFRF
jgi:hypothetical protein